MNLELFLLLMEATRMMEVVRLSNRIHLGKIVWVKGEEN